MSKFIEQRSAIMHHLILHWLFVLISPHFQLIPFRNHRIRLIYLRVNSGYSANSHDHFEQWPVRQALTPGQKSITSESLVDPKKAIDRNGRGLLYLKQKFPRVSDAKIKEGIFVGPQIRELMKDETFEEMLDETEIRVWSAFKSIV